MPLVENHPAAGMQSDCTGGELWNAAVSSWLGSSQHVGATVVSMAPLGN